MFAGIDPPVSSNFRWCLKNIPLLNSLLRLYIYWRAENFQNFLDFTESGAQIRETWERVSKRYILSAAPEKYHSILIPKYELGCKVCSSSFKYFSDENCFVKRRIFDRDGAYMKALHSPNMLLTKEPITKIGPEGVYTAEKTYPADVIILANGFETGFAGLNTVNVYGRNGQSLHEYWGGFGGPMAYNCTAIPDCKCIQIFNWSI